MQFYSFTFCAFLLPLALGAYYALQRAQRARAAVLSLIVTSAIYYGWCDPRGLWIIGGSIAINFALSVAIMRSMSMGANFLAKAAFAIGLAGNLMVLGWFKYACLLDASGACAVAVLPLAISFFTFQQIEYLWDTLTGRVGRESIFNYCLFVLFFPHLLAGPITKHSEMMPQFGAGDQNVRSNIALGLAIFTVGLAKKILIADSIAIYSNPVFGAADLGQPVSLIPAWFGAIGFTLQLYFDFSGYSDMALGVSRMFGIRLPLNFNSPLKATNIVDFWQRWHMTLTRYINTHLYNGLALILARWRGRFRPTGLLPLFALDVVVAVVVPTMVTMTIAGIWHGAGMQFLVFGALHGIYLTLFRAWQWLARRTGICKAIDAVIPVAIGRILTFTLVVVSFVFFKAGSVGAALSMIDGMMGLNGVGIPEAYLDERLGQLGQILISLGVEPIRNLEGSLFFGFRQVGLLAAGIAIAWWTPNTQSIFSAYLARAPRARDLPSARQPVVYAVSAPTGWWARAVWHPGAVTGLLAAILLVVSLSKANYSPVEFLYFQF